MKVFVFALFIAFWDLERLLTVFRSKISIVSSKKDHYCAKLHKLMERWVIIMMVQVE